MRQLDRILGNQRLIFDVLALLAPQQPDNETYLRSRFNGIPPPFEDSDGKLVEWLLHNKQTKAKAIHKINQPLIRKLEDGTDNLDLMTRSKVKRETLRL